MLTGLFVPGITTQPDATKKANHGIAVYADGGCNPNPGQGGWGVHAYVYDFSEVKKGIGLGQVVASNEGYCEKSILGQLERDEATVTKLYEMYKNSDIFNNAIQVNVLCYHDRFGGIIEATNQVAELKAAIEGLNLVLELNNTTAFRECLLYSDSQYMLNGITKWIVGWLNNNWQNSSGEPVANQTLWKELNLKTQAVFEAGINLRWAWVRGHVGDPGNEQADLNATAGVTLAHKRNEVPQHRTYEGTGYWSQTLPYNRMFSQPNWYFISNAPDTILPDGRHIYCTGYHGLEDEYIGRRQGEASYTLLYTKERWAILDIIRNYQNSLLRSKEPSFVIGKLSNIKLARNIVEITATNDLLLSRKRGRDCNLQMPSEDLITREVNPPRMSYTVVDSFSNLAMILKSFMNNTDDIAVTEITNLFYEIDSSKKKSVLKFNKDITTSTSYIKTNVGYRTETRSGSVSITLIFGKDLYVRNDLSALTERNPKIHVVTWAESDNVFRYATILQADDDIAITAGVYSNLRLLAEA